MLGFSMTLTATRAAVPELGGVLVGLGRAVVAALLAVGVLAWRRELAFPWRHVRALTGVALGVVIGFPLLSALALRTVPASHAQIFLGLSPLGTAIAASLRDRRERLPRTFWLAASLGAITVAWFGWSNGGGAFSSSDVSLLLAVACAAIGYAEGARLARELGGFRVVCWALILALPVTLPLSAWALVEAPPTHVTWRAYLGFGYVSAVSMFLAFGAWYRGLALGNIARASQIQLAMPVLGLVWAALLLHERLTPHAILAGLCVIVCTLGTQWIGARPRPTKALTTTGGPWTPLSKCDR